MSHQRIAPGFPRPRSRPAHGLPFARCLTLLMFFAICVCGCTEPTETSGPVDVSISESAKANPDLTERQRTFECVEIAAGLSTPAGIAVQPDTGDIFVSTAKGVQRIIVSKDYTVRTEIGDFDQDSYGAGPTYHFGPLGLAFRGTSELVIGGGGRADGEDTLSFFHVGTDKTSEPQSAADAEHRVGPIGKGRQSSRGEGNYFAVLAHKDRVFTASHGDDTKGWISEVVLKNGIPSSLQPLLASKVLAHVDGPSALVMLDDKRLLVSLTGELNERPDSVLAIFDIESGDVVRRIDTGLHDITAAVLHPSTGLLYVVDFAWASPEQGGLFSMDLSSDTPIPIRHQTLVHPAAMTIDSSGNLIVACVGDQDGSDFPTGTLKMITPQPIR